MIYKIFNNTGNLGKRDVKYNSILDIEYKDGINTKKIALLPNQIFFLVTNSLPLSLHKMRMQKWVVIDEVSKKEFQNHVISESLNNNGLLQIINEEQETVQSEIVEDLKDDSEKSKELEEKKQEKKHSTKK